MNEQKWRVVVKVGTSTLTHSSGSLDLRSMERLVRVLADLSGGGHEVILVTSGAIAVGTARMGLDERPRALRMKQAAAAVGQCRMMHIYDKLFSEYNCTVAQILLHVLPGAGGASEKHLCQPPGAGHYPGGERERLRILRRD